LDIRHTTLSSSLSKRKYVNSTTAIEITIHRLAAKKTLDVNLSRSKVELPAFGLISAAERGGYRYTF